MHSVLLTIALGTAVIIRILWQPGQGTWQQRWQQAWIAFVLPPVLLLSSAIAVLLMGPTGSMVHSGEGWLTYGLAIGFVGIAAGLGIWLGLEGQKSLHTLQQSPQCTVLDRSARLLDIPMPFVAQVGFWNSELVLSQGLLDTLDEAHLQAVLTHEQAHHCYRDTFWFFWLGWLRRLTAWLPKSDRLWQELLMLREMRADAWAAQTIDPLLLAEALVTLVRTPMAHPEPVAAFSPEPLVDRLSERISALLESPQASPSIRDWPTLLGVMLAIEPLLLVPFHH